MSQDILDQETNQEKWDVNFKARPVIIWGALLIIGILFRIMYWPFAAVLILIPSAGLQAYCFTSILKSKKNTMNLMLVILGFIWLLILIWGAYFNYGHPFNEFGLSIYFIAFTIYFTIYTLINHRTKNRLNKS